MIWDLIYRSGRFCFRAGLVLFVLTTSSCLTVTTRSRTVQEAVPGGFEPGSQVLTELPLQSSEIEFAARMDRNNLLIQTSRVYGSHQIWGVFSYELILTDPAAGLIRWRKSNDVLQSGVEDIFYNDRALYISGGDYGDDRQRLSALRREDGQILWQRKDPRHFSYFYMEDKSIIIAAGRDGSGFSLTALDADTGDRLWKIERKASFALDCFPSCGFMREGDNVLVSGTFLLSIALDDGSLNWEKKINGDPSILPEIYSTGYGILITQKRGFILIDRRTGYDIWYNTILDSTILTGNLIGDSVLAVYDGPEGLSLHSYGLLKGGLNWRTALNGFPRSPIITDGLEVLISDKASLLSFSLGDGALTKIREIPSFLQSELGLPDRIIRRGDKIMLARECGIVAYAKDSADTLYARYVEGTEMYCYHSASQRYLLRQVARSGQGQNFRHRELITELKLQLIRFARGSASEAQADFPGMGCLSLCDPPLRSSCRSCHVVSEGIAFQDEGAARNMDINKREIQAAVNCHALCLQGDYYIRPFYRDGWGVTLIRLDDGARSDLNISPDAEPLIINGGNFPFYGLDGNYLITNGLGRSRTERNMFTKTGYGKDVFGSWPGSPSNWHLPYSSLYTFSLEDLEFSTGDDPEPPPVPRPGEKELKLRQFILQRDEEAVRDILNAGADTNALDPLGWNALFYSAIVDDRKIARILVDKGADATLRDPHQFLAYHYNILTHGLTQSTIVFRSANIKQGDRGKK